MTIPAACRAFAIFAPTISLVLLLAPATTWGQGLIPGTGRPVEGAGDDFEDATWEFYHNFPKSSHEQDKEARRPTGYSSNQRWFESPKRGQPDVIQRVDTPDGGIAGSQSALLMRSYYTDLPGRSTGATGQDDLLFDCAQAVGGSIPMSWQPSVVVRVYLPPFDQWEPATGSSFGFRFGITGEGWTEKKGLFGTRRVKDRDSFYPGMFIQFNSRRDGFEKDTAVLIIRGDDYGRDYNGPVITEPGWWTLGMSMTVDGRCHYYASPGVDSLTAADHIGSHFPQGVKPEVFRTFFFDVCNQSSGRQWSTPWIIDDPQLYITR